MTSKLKNDPQPPPHPKKLKYLTTISIMLGNITFGCAFNFYSPALEDIRIKYETDVDDISTVFTIMLVCYCAGALSSMIIYKYINRQLGVIICLGGMAAGLFLTPHCPSKTLFFVVGGMLGYFVGSYDATQVVWMIEIWQEKSGPFIQGQHFCYALGTNIPPLLLGPFLRGDVDEDDEDVTTTPMSQSESKMYIPFSIGGSLSAAACCIQVFLFIFYRYYKPPLYNNNNNNNDTYDDQNNNNESTNPTEPEETFKKSKTSKTILDVVTSQKFKLVLVMGAFAGAYQGMEMCTLQFIPTFGQYSAIDLSESSAASVLTGLTAAFAVGRFFGIFIILKVHPIVMLMVSLVIVFIGNTILFFWAGESVTMFWVACCVVGLGFSTIYASFSAFMEKHIIFTDFVGGWMIVCGSSLAAIYPIIVGASIEDDTVILSWVNYVSIGICASSLGIGWWLVSGNNNVKERTQKQRV